jgi:hypothetical protein
MLVHASDRGIIKLMFPRFLILGCSGEILKNLQHAVQKAYHFFSLIFMSIDFSKRCGVTE